MGLIQENGRIKKLLLYVENRSYAYLELADTMQPQYFELPEDDIKVLNGGMLEPHPLHVYIPQE